MKVKVCLDYAECKSKREAKKSAAEISKRIAEREIDIELQELVYEVGNNGRSYTPAIFDGNRDIHSFKAMQIFCLDFDDGNISCEEIIERGKRFELPVVFIYETLSSSEELKKYRVGFLHIVPVENADIALFILRILRSIYPEADKNCTEVARMYFGGKCIVYYDTNEPVFRKRLNFSR